MRTYISYAHRDQQFAERLAKALREAGIETWIDKLQIKVGDNLVEKIEEGLQSSDALIVVLSQAYAQSVWVQRELSTFAMSEVSQDRSIIYPVLIEDTEIPVFLRDRLYADFRSSFEDGFRALLSAIKAQQRRKRRIPTTTSVRKGIKESSIELQITRIKAEYSAGNLSLFCGAGVSFKAGVPTWETLLQTLLSSLFGRHGDGGSQSDLLTYTRIISVLHP